MQRAPECFKCKHLHRPIPANPEAAVTCAAFPAGIPDRFLFGVDKPGAETTDSGTPEPHHKIAPGQTGDFVFEEMDVRARITQPLRP